jgi:apolipoprotein D and lipocalin family protein
MLPYETQGADPFTPDGVSVRRIKLSALAPLLGLIGCQSAPLPPLTTVPHVELERFMGDWYVIANIPTFIERCAHNAIESYRLAEDGTIDTTFTFNADGFDGPLKRYTPRGFVREHESNAIWGMQFVWPIKADYRIVYLDADYSQTVVGRKQRDYLWIMAREPSMPDADYARLVEFVGEQGYDVSQIQRVPQRWPARSGG